MPISTLTRRLGRCVCAATTTALLLTGCDDTAGSAGAHQVTVQWRSPTVNEDGSPLTDLAGFRIQHGTRSNLYTRVIDIPDAAATSYTVEGLSTGTHFFTITAYNRSNADGVESQELAIRLP